MRMSRVAWVSYDPTCRLVAETADTTWDEFDEYGLLGLDKHIDAGGTAPVCPDTVPHCVLYQRGPGVTGEDPVRSRVSAASQGDHMIQLGSLSPDSLVLVAEAGEVSALRISVANEKLVIMIKTELFLHKITYVSLLSKHKV